MPQVARGAAVPCPVPEVEHGSCAFELHNFASTSKALYSCRPAVPWTDCVLVPLKVPTLGANYRRLTCMQRHLCLASCISNPVCYRKEACALRYFRLSSLNSSRAATAVTASALMRGLCLQPRLQAGQAPKAAERCNVKVRACCR